jgi:mannose-1-phosphate guanylyltransferase
MTTPVKEPISIVLAGGDGMRLRPLTERWLGRHVPKQYCAFAGTRSMLDHTLDRAASLCDPSRILTVVGRAHREVRRARAPRASDGAFIEQPLNLDTAPGVLLGLAFAMHRDPDATVVIFPSDHFVHPEQRFLNRVRVAIQAAERLEERILLLGAPPTNIEDDYGWIVPSDYLEFSTTRPVFAVESFVEKPPAPEAAGLYRRGALWNTLVLVARARTLWDLACELLPTLTPFFEVLQPAIGTPQEARVLDELYETMPRVNFSSGLLERASDRIAMLPLEGVMWSDWGQPARIVESLLAIGRQPAFSPQLLEPEQQALHGAYRPEAA